MEGAALAPGNEGSARACASSKTDARPRGQRHASAGSLGRGAGLERHGRRAQPDGCLPGRHAAHRLGHAGAFPEAAVPGAGWPGVAV